MKKCVFLLILSMCFIRPVFSAEQNKNDFPAELWNQAKAEKNTGKAIELCGQVMAASPEFAEAYMLRAKLYRKSKQYPLAVRDFSRYIALQPDDFMGYYAKARLYTKVKRPHLAVKTMTAYININPADPKGFFERGYIYRYFGKNLAASIDDFSKVIEISPKESTAYTERGLSYLGINSYERAIGDFTQALSIDPRSAIAYRERGHCYKEMDEYEKAIQDCKKSLEFDPNYPWTYYFIAASYYRLKKFEPALDFADKAVEKMKSDFTIELRANIHRDKGQYEKALADIQEAFGLGGKYFFTRASIYFAMGDRAKASEDLMNLFIENESADTEPFNIVVMERVDGLPAFVAEVKAKYLDLKKKYGKVQPVS